MCNISKTALCFAVLVAISLRNSKATQTQHIADAAEAVNFALLALAESQAPDTPAILGALQAAQYALGRALKVPARQLDEMLESVTTGEHQQQPQQTASPLNQGRTSGVRTPPPPPPTVAVGPPQGKTQAPTQKVPFSPYLYTNIIQMHPRYAQASRKLTLKQLQDIIWPQ